MFLSKVIKCYELPSCTLKILANDRCCLLIENLDFSQQTDLKFNLDRAQLNQISYSVKKQLDRQPENQQVYTVILPLSDSPNSIEITWQQLTDLNKILEEYQTDLANGNLITFRKKRTFWGLVSLFIVLIAGGITLSLNWYRKQVKTMITSSPPLSQPTENTSSPSSENPLSPLPKNLSQKPNLQLSESLKTLDNLSPPSSIDPPSSPTPVKTISIPKKTPIPEKNPPLSSPETPETIEAPQLPPLAKFKKQRTSSTITPSNPTSQLLEVKKYFQAKWQPPENLKQHLEYQLLINADGTLQEITPLGIISETYLSRLPLPESNEDFVSPSPTEKPQKMRLVFPPNGNIKTFLTNGHPQAPSSHGGVRMTD
ncbi:UNVERIFIED_CONTAM: hypothetical protein BEN50_12380 [Euhalothece sp. KZN 001]